MMIKYAELDRIKRLNLPRMLREYGLELAENGNGGYTARCPFHDDHEPSLVVSPGKNLFHCLGCGAAGTVIDWVMRSRSLPFRDAVELLRQDSGQSRPTMREPECPLDPAATDAALLDQVESQISEIGDELGHGTLQRQKWTVRSLSRTAA